MFGYPKGVDKLQDLEDKIKGAFYGIAIGDALGATVEFMTKKQIQEKYGVLRDIIGGGWLNLRPGEWTDDTEMTLAVAEGIMDDHQNPVPQIGRRFLSWRATNPPDIGNTIRAVFNFTDRFLPPVTEKNWHTAAEKVAERMPTAGNGALMRTMPVALAYEGAELIEKARGIASMTHFDQEAGMSCVLYCLAARNYLSGMKKTRGWAKARNDLNSIIGRDNTRGFWEVYKRSSHRLDPTGYTMDSLACAVQSFLRTRSFEGAAISAVNLGGDADTIGAITGGLAGAYWGYNSIPEKWIKKFTDRQKSRLDNAINWFIDHNRRCID